jgi:hypothetical protein
VFKPAAGSSEQASAGAWAALAGFAAQTARSKVAASRDGLPRLAIGYVLPASQPELLSTHEKCGGF